MLPRTNVIKENKTIKPYYIPISTCKYKHKTLTEEEITTLAEGRWGNLCKCHIPSIYQSKIFPHFDTKLTPLYGSVDPYHSISSTFIYIISNQSLKSGKGELWTP